MNMSVSKAAKPGLLCILLCSEAQPHKGSSEYEFECNEEKMCFFPSSFKDLGLYSKNLYRKTKRARLCGTWRVEVARWKFKAILDRRRSFFKTATIKRPWIRILRLLKNNQRVRQCLETSNKSYSQPWIINEHHATSKLWFMVKHGDMGIVLTQL